MDREKALVILKQNLKAENLISHSLAVEAVMTALAQKLGEDEALWGLAGLLHDIDYEQTADDPLHHGLISEQILSEYDLPESLIHAIKAHNQDAGIPLETIFDRALYCADPITGLLTACALVKPSKKLEDVENSSVKKKFKDKAFARGASREQIDSCTDIGLERAEFIDIALAGMKKIASDIGL